MNNKNLDTGFAPEINTLIAEVMSEIKFDGVAMAVKFDTSKNVFPVKTYKSVSVSLKGVKRPILMWGLQNKQPREVNHRVAESEILGKGLEYLIDTAYGDGVMPCKIENLPDGKKNYLPYDLTGDAKEFFENSNVNNYIKTALTNLFYFGQAYVELPFDKKPKDRNVVLISCKDTTYCRLEEPNDNGDIENMVYFADWGYREPSDSNSVVFPILDFDLPTYDLLVRTGRKPNKQGKLVDDKGTRYIYRLALIKPGKRDYPEPVWWSLFRSGWFDFAQAIPKFKRALMENQMMVKYIIYMDKNYFTDIFTEDNITDQKAKKERILKEFENWKAFLTDTKNTGKNIIGRITYSPDGKGEPRKNVIFEVLPNTFKGGEYLEDSQEVSKLFGTALGLNLNMIGDIPGKGGNMSGTDIRERFIILNAQMSAIRHMVLAPLYAIKKINGWPDDLEFTIPNVQLTTLDKGTGATKSIGAPAV